jgi:hypothetical protein
MRAQVVHRSLRKLQQIRFWAALRVLTRQCLYRRIPDKDTSAREAMHWMHDCNVQQSTINWRFTTRNARIKLKRQYPAILP